MKNLFWAALALLVPSALAAQDPTEAAIQQACAPFEHYQPGSSAQPTEADRKAFKAEEGCYGYFYAWEGESNYDKGRRCCLVRGDCNRELAMAYANGWGTPRDLDAATYFLCRSGDEMGWLGMQAGMLKFVADLRTGEKTGDLDYCEYSADGRETKWCAVLALDRKRVEWNRRVSAIKRTLNPEARQALASLRKAADALAKADARFMAEGNFGGTIYSSVLLNSQAQRGDDLLATLELYVQKRAPATTPASLKEASDALSSMYEERMAVAKACDKEVRQGGAQKVVRGTRRAWLPYRDAWIAFYRLRWKGAASPKELGREIATALTEKRPQELAVSEEEP